MKPTWESEGVQLYLGDCLEIMPELAGVDAVVTDPPFNAGKEFANDSLDRDAADYFLWGWASALSRLSPKNVVVEVPKDSLDIALELSRHFDFRHAICLNYTNSMRNGAVGYSNWGMALWFSRGGRCIHRYKDRIDEAIHNTIDEFRHPSPKEVGHYAKLIHMFSEVEKTVLDPFMGSGTTGVACVQTGRKFIGVEIDPGYFEIAKNRISEARLQIRMPLDVD